MARIRRSAVVRIFDRADDIDILGGDGALYRVSGDSAELIRAVLDYLSEARTHDELRAHVSELSGQNASLSSALEQALVMLRAAGVVTDDPVDQAPKPLAASGLREGLRVVVALSGGIAAAYAPALGELLLGRGFRVRFAATDSALRFVTPLALCALSHEPVATSLWPSEQSEAVPHIALSRWAELVLVYPATATTLSRIAAGDCSTVVSAVAISTRAPVLLVPAMNETMFRSPSVQRNLEQLKHDGFVLLHPSLGYEVANAPGERRPTFGAAPPVQAVVEVVEAVVRELKIES